MSESSKTCQAKTESFSRRFESLYIHVPFCLQGKCDYCAFYSLPCSTPVQQQSYLRKLAADAENAREKCGALRSIFLGGGTPTSLTTRQLQQLFAIIRNNFCLAPDCEITSEANPESLTPARLETLLACGCNRLSLGVQSFSSTMRKTMGRRGSLQKLPEICHILQKNNFSNYNFDLIFNIPGETTAIWTEDLEKACSFNPCHISTYALTLEEHTPLAKRLAQPGDDYFLSFWHLTRKILATAGLRQYEISNFAIPGRQCRHNYDVWHGATYLGLGPAAISFDGDCRLTNPPDLDAWLAGAKPEIDRIPRQHRISEIFAFGLRTTAGWEINSLEKLCGPDILQRYQRPLNALTKLKLLRTTKNTIRPTVKGLLFNDTILEKILDEA